MYPRWPQEERQHHVAEGLHTIWGYMGAIYMGYIRRNDRTMQPKVCALGEAWEIERAIGTTEPSGRRSVYKFDPSDSTRLDSYCVCMCVEPKT